MVDDDVELSDALKCCYSFDKRGSEAWMKHCLFLPRGIFIQRSARVKGFVLCHACQSDVRRATVPTKAIINGFFFGSPPPVLTDLNDDEIAVLTPVDCFQILFCIQWWESDEVARNARLLQSCKMEDSKEQQLLHTLWANHLNRNVIFLLTGDMTKSQKRKGNAQDRNSATKNDAGNWVACQEQSFWHGLDI